MVIKIDHSKCLSADKCGKCMRICPLGVFMKVPVGKFNPEKPPEKFRIEPFFEEICDGCKACVRICPVKCIELNL